ncbi:multidrug efflux SMR transporter [Vibrio hannami]|nr:multidrug efflux SMR transporter [Vibrio hannami]MDG3086616.1 multidrug efflux SMR transporter [Vibrio hannami]
MKGYVYLGFSIIGEVFATAMLKMSEGFTVLLPTIGVIIGYALSFYLISLSLKTIPLSLAYAVWSGVGTALTALIGVVVWNDPFNMQMLCVIILTGGVALLNSSKTSANKKEPSI